MLRESSLWKSSSDMICLYGCSLIMYKGKCQSSVAVAGWVPEPKVNKKLIKYFKPVELSGLCRGWESWKLEEGKGRASLVGKWQAVWAGQGSPGNKTKRGRLACHTDMFVSTLVWCSHIMYANCYISFFFFPWEILGWEALKPKRQCRNANM